MKKIYSLIAAVLMCFTGTANAQPHSWQFADGSADGVNIETIEEGKVYAIQEGISQRYSKSGFLHSGGGDVSAKLTYECGYQFVKFTTNTVGGQTFDVWGLKNVANGKYLALEGGNFIYVPTNPEAFHFTAQHAKEFDSHCGENGEPTVFPADNWLEYSNAVEGGEYGRNAGAEEQGAWVFCHYQKRQFFSLLGNPGLADGKYVDANNWFVKELVEAPVAWDEVYSAVFYKYFTFDTEEQIPELFPVGDAIGCIDQETQDALVNLFSTSFNMLGEATAEEYQAQIKVIEEFFNVTLPAHTVSFKPGYYVLRNVGGRGFLTITDDGHGRGNGALASENVVEGTKYENWTVESTTEWNVTNAKYIWKLEKSAKSGDFLFKNFANGKYLATANEHETVAEAEKATPLKINSYSNPGEFYMTYPGGMIHVANHSNNKLLNFVDANDAASRWNFFEINNDIVANLATVVEQEAKNQKLAALLKDAKSDYETSKFMNGFIDGLDYATPGDAGLVTSATGTPQYGDNTGFANLFDGDHNTIYHSKHGDKAENHYIQFNLGKELQEITLKFSKRCGNSVNNHVNEFILQAPVDTNDLAGEWVEVGACPWLDSGDTIQYTYEEILDPESKSAKFTKRGTWIGNIELSQPCKYLRFVVVSTWGRDLGALGPNENGSGPLWHMSEFRVYDPAETVENPAFAEIPADVMDAFKNALAQAEKEVAEGTATDATYETLEAAQKAFWKAYPNSGELEGRVATAIGIANNAVEGSEWGQYQDGAVAAFAEVANSIDADIKAIKESGLVVTLSQIKDYTAQLDAATAQLNSQLNTPADGDIIMMVGRSTAVKADGSPEEQNGACIVSIDADVQGGTPVFRYNFDKETMDPRFNALWKVEKVDGKGFAFKNLANGLYMNNKYYGLSETEIEALDKKIEETKDSRMGYSVTPKYFQLETYAVEGYGENFVLVLKKGTFLNFQNTGKTIVHYGLREDPNSPVEFFNAGGKLGIEFDGTYELPAEANTFVTKCMPIDLTMIIDGTKSNCAYEVLGVKDNQLQLKAFEGTIPAGTPFVIYNKHEGSKTVNAIMSIGDLSEAGSLVYNYDIVEKNGMVSVPNALTIDEGYGYINSNWLIPSRKGQKVAGGTALFNKHLPVATADGALAIKMEGIISGEGDATAVEEVVVVKNVPTDVYTISGVKVRSNVKAANATQGLPKGVYIVGGKKVIVK